MAINYEYERHIRAAVESGNKTGAEALQAQRVIFNSLLKTGIVQELPRESREERTHGSFSSFAAGVPPPSQAFSLTMTEAAKILGVSAPKLRKLIRAGSIPAWRNPLDNRQLLIPATAIERLAQAGSYAPEEERTVSASKEG